MAERAPVTVRASEPTPESPLKAQRQSQSITRASKRFKETIEDVKTVDRRARVEIDSATGWVRAIRGKFAVGRPVPQHVTRGYRYMVSASELGDHPAVVFLERFGALFGLDDANDQVFLRGITPLSQGDWMAFGIDTFTASTTRHAQIDIVVAPSGEVIYAGFGQAGEVPARA